MTHAPNPLRSAYSDAPESPTQPHSEETGHSARLDLIGSIAGNLLIGDGDPDALVRDAFERLSEHLGLEVYVNYLIDEERQGLRLQACAGIDDEAVERLRWLDFGQAVCGTVARDGQRRVVEHVLESEDPLTEFIRSIGIRAYACQALVMSGRTVGTLSFGTRRRDAFEPEELDLMQTVSDLAAAAFERAALLQDVESRASALNEIARFQSLLLNSMSQAVMATDNDGRVTAWNQRAEELYGWTADEAVGRSIYDLTVPDTSRAQAHDIMDTLGRGETWAGEFVVQRKDGSTFLASIRNSPLVDAHGRPLGVIGLSEDITAQRARESAIREEQERRAQWLAFTSHELRSPLTSIVGYASRLRRRVEANAAFASVQEEVEMLAAEARRMERSIELVLKVAALDADNVTLTREPLYLVDLIEDEVAAVRRRHRHAEVETRGLHDDVSLISDGGAIRLILRNLIENGTKYGGDPPVVIVETDASTGDEVSVTVADNGNGIPGADLPRVFERYYRGAGAASASTGLGLGLYISHQLAGLLGGWLVAESKEGEGARFRLTLPREMP
jgi:PAS domain S-box-containing protein